MSNPLSHRLIRCTRHIFCGGCCRSSLRCGRGFENKRPRRREGECLANPFSLFLTLENDDQLPGTAVGDRTSRIMQSMSNPIRSTCTSSVRSLSPSQPYQACFVWHPFNIHITHQTLSPFALFFPIRFHNPYNLNRRGTEAEMVAARMETEAPETKTVRQMGAVKVRLKPLGMDRDRRRYWLLAKGEVRRGTQTMFHDEGLGLCASLFIKRSERCLPCTPVKSMWFSSYCSTVVAGIISSVVR